MSKAKRKITKFNFESEGAHLSLVTQAANLQQALVMKSLTASEEEIHKALEVNLKISMREFFGRYLDIDEDDMETILGMMGYSPEDLYDEYYLEDLGDIVRDNMGKATVGNFVDTFKSFDAKYLTKDSVLSVESQGEGVVKTEGKKEETNKGEGNMSQDQTDLQEQIEKAAEAIVAKRIDAVEKAANERVDKVSKELDVFKAREEAREGQEMLAKAEDFSRYLGEGADKEAIAKALAFIEKSEEAETVNQLLKDLKGALDKESGFEEIGKSATEDQPTDDESKVSTIQKTLMEGDAGMNEQDAFVKAYEQVHSI